jgi:preprotein translocase subunit YajC
MRVFVKRKQSSNMKEGSFMRRTSIFALTVTLSWLLAAHTIWAQQKANDKEHAELAKALKGGEDIFRKRTLGK